jgi:signal transduction histidine kinase
MRRFILGHAVPRAEHLPSGVFQHRALRIALGYAGAVGIVAVTVVLKYGLNIFLERDSEFLLFFAAVMVAAWYGGLGPGLLATVLADVASNFFFMDEPRYSLRFTHDQGIRLGLFLVEGISISVLAGFLQRARQRAEESAAVARELEHTLAEVSEAERRRLGRDLHDGLGQHRTGVALLSKALQQKLATAGRAEGAVAGEIAELVNESIDSIRDLARGLSPMDLDRTSLPSALRELAARTERLCRVECAFEGDDALVVADDDTALNLYRVAQEAVNNAVKHASAKHVWITLSADADGRAALRVRDDGVGLPRRAAEATVPAGPAAAANAGNGLGSASRGAGRTLGPSRAHGGRSGGSHGGTHGVGDGKGMGLRIMKYRANVVGARFELESAPGRGTTVSCVLPADRGTAAAASPDAEDTDHAGMIPAALPVVRRAIQSNGR